MEKNNVPKEIIAIAKALKDSGHDAYLVGGCVRDLILKKNRQTGT